MAAKLKALEPGHGVLLGKAAVLGSFNETARRFDLHKTGPRGRDFTLKMCWAADRRRALFCGANHAVPHRLNDVWEFDLPSLSWILLYPPDLPRGYVDLGKDTSDVQFQGGVLVTSRGGPAVIAHSWWGLTYDPQHKALLLMNTWVTKRAAAVAKLGGDPEKLYLGPPLWAFYPGTGKWKPVLSPKPYPRPIFGGMLEYVPDLGGAVWHANNWQMRATWRYDGAKASWSNLQANGDAKAFEREAAQPEQIGYYDTARKQLIVHRHYDTHHYDVKSNRWTRVLSGNKKDGRTPYGHDARAVFYGDPVSGHGLLVQFQTNTIWAYDTQKVSWTRLGLKGDPMPTGNKRLAYVDPAMNVVVVIDRTEIWAYRYRSGPTKKE